jgi:asparagine synthase (glutamine-hydrolysing)
MQLAPIEPASLQAMTAAMIHRGPDEGGQMLAPGIALGMRRLSIIDLPSSHQPLASEDGRVITVFNGEIFNFLRLREELVHRGHRFVTSGDTETIVHLYEEYGTGFVSRLRGMFAIAIWDAAERKLVLARDRLGVKPLYYALGLSGLMFASEIKCFIAAGLLSPRLDPDAASLFLALGYVPGPRTLFEGVLKLPPASVLEWHAGKLTGPTSYWTPADPPSAAPGGWREDEDHLLELLRAAVRARMISDVPLGVMLSGGLDSSLIAGLMAEASSAPIETFSIGFTDDAGANELAWARRTATRLGANHHELETSAAAHVGLLDEALWHLEEPIADLSFLGFLLLSKLARQHVTVALCGQAADELLGGYPKHVAARLADVAEGCPLFLRRLLGAAARSGDQHVRLHRLLAVIAAERDLERLWAMSALLTPRLGHALEGPVLREMDAFELFEQSGAADANLPAGRSCLTRTLLLDLHLALPDLMFLYFDKMSMASSLEVRVPFADHDVVNFCMSLPDNRRIRRLRGKEILRRISVDLVDEAIINRPKRGFFRAASSAWLERNLDLVRDTLLDPRCRERGLLDPATLQRWLTAPLGSGRAGEPLLAAFLLERWHRLFVDSDGLAQRRAARTTVSSSVADFPR